MEKLRIFLDMLALTVAALGVAFVVSTAVMSMPVFILANSALPDGVMLTIWIALAGMIFCTCIFAAWKYDRHKIIYEETRSRGQSFLLWETFAFLLFYLLFVISFRTDLDWPVLIGLCLPVAALIAALAFPFRSCRSGLLQAGRWCGFLGAFSLFFWGALILGRTGKIVSYRGDDPAGFPRSVRWIGEAYVPAGASRIDLSGRSTACRWSCHVAERDFMTFKAKRAFDFSKVEKPRDIMDKGPFPYYFYEKRHRNGGGITLRYDVKKQRMTGFYSHH